MRRFRGRHRSLETRLRRERPQPTDDLIRLIGEKIDGTPAPRRWNAGFAFALTLALVAAFALTGGISYAASAVHHGTQAVTHLVSGHSSASENSTTSANSSSRTRGERSGREHESNKSNGEKGGNKNDEQGDDDEDDPGDDQYEERVLICHHPNGEHPHTIRVSPNAVAAHLAHGDTSGPCPRRTHENDD